MPRSLKRRVGWLAVVCCATVVLAIGGAWDQILAAYNRHLLEAGDRDEQLEAATYLAKGLGADRWRVEEWVLQRLVQDVRRVTEGADPGRQSTLSDSLTFHATIENLVLLGRYGLLPDLIQGVPSEVREHRMWALAGQLVASDATPEAHVVQTLERSGPLAAVSEIEAWRHQSHRDRLVAVLADAISRRNDCRDILDRLSFQVEQPSGRTADLSIVGVLQARLGDVDRAWSTMQKLKEWRRPDLDARRRIVEVLVRENRLSDLEPLLAGIPNARRRAIVVAQIGRVLASAGATELAYHYLDRVEGLTDCLASTYWELFGVAERAVAREAGAAFLFLGQRARSREILERLVTLLPAQNKIRRFDQPLLHGIVRDQLQGGDPEGAAATASSISDPYRESALVHIAAYQASCGEFDAAVEAALSTRIPYFTAGALAVTALHAMRQGRERLASDILSRPYGQITDPGVLVTEYTTRRVIFPTTSLQGQAGMLARALDQVSTREDRVSRAHLLTGLAEGVTERRLLERGLVESPWESAAATEAEAVLASTAAPGRSGPGTWKDSEESDGKARNDSSPR